MNTSRLTIFLIAVVSSSALGCANNNDTPPPDKESKIKAALEQLDPTDHKLAEEQKYCAVQTKKRLGSMGKPIKVLVKDQPVFLCCEGCEKTALKDADKTLAAVRKLKTESKESHHESHEEHE